MILIRICWYLCALFLAALFCTSLIGVAPGGEDDLIVAATVLFAFALAAASSAILLRRRFRRNPDAPIFRSKIVAGFCMALAAMLTLLFLTGVLA